MNTYKRHRFPPDIISYAVWLYYIFNLGRHLVGAQHYRKLTAYRSNITPDRK